MPAPSYLVLLHEDGLHKLAEYKDRLAKGSIRPGAHLNQRINNVSLNEIQTEKFLELLLQTKKPCIFAESEVSFDGSDWTKEEFSILGDVSIAVEVTVFDNGAWSRSDANFRRHEPPFLAHLLFVPGPLLTVSRSPDYQETVDDERRLNYEKYAVLVKRRLVPLFHFVQSRATDKNKAIVTIPGIGCGAFGGNFTGVLPTFLQKVIREILKENSKKLENIDCVVFDPFRGETTTEQIGHISYRTRPYLKHSKPQLSKPVSFQEENDNFSQHQLFKIVAWDHVSYPGNDFFRNSRLTDDGVAAAATDSMAKILGVEGTCTSNTNYKPPAGFNNWENVVKKNNIQLYVKNNLRVFLDTTESAPL